LLACALAGIPSAMIARVHGSILQGIDAVGCEVETDVVPSADKPDIKLVALADKAVQVETKRGSLGNRISGDPPWRKSASRIQAALRNSPDACRDWPAPKVTISLAPADVKKDSAAFDLPIVLANRLWPSVWAMSQRTSKTSRGSWLWRMMESSVPTRISR